MNLEFPCWREETLQIEGFKFMSLREVPTLEVILGRFLEAILGKISKRKLENVIEGRIPRRILKYRPIPGNAHLYTV